MNIKLTQSTADVFVPDGIEISSAVERVTHLGVGAHPDDLEFMAFHGIMSCFHHDDKRWFGGVTCTNGAGSARQGLYASYTDDEMIQVRRQEQRAAAAIGRYAVMIQLDHPSPVAKSPAPNALSEDLVEVVRATKPEVVYTHHPADKHQTHLGVFASLLRALRSLPASEQPRQLLGCEVWRGLDWMPDREKVALDVSGYDHLAAALCGVFDSQIAGGKRYDTAILGRRAANATFFESGSIDQSSQLCYAMDLTPLMQNCELDPVGFIMETIDRFKQEVYDGLRQVISSRS
ncbi:MAG: PIG-L deacetylase family protein [Candidatus Methylacidiphilales bacterium]